MNKYVFFAILVATCKCLAYNFEPIPIHYSISESLKVPIDPIEIGYIIPLYIGPTSIDIDSMENIYIFHADIKSIVSKYSKDGKLLWRNINNLGILAFKYFQENVYAFNGKKIFIFNSSTGKIRDTINLPIDEKQVSQIINQSNFYGQYLFINDLKFVKSLPRENLLFIYDIATRKMSKREPEDSKFYPITNCNACSIEFVKDIFVELRLNFIDQSTESILLLKEDEKGVDYNESIYIFNKKKGYVHSIDSLPFFDDMGFTSTRYGILVKENRIVVCVIIQEEYIPKELCFYFIDLKKPRKAHK